MLGMISTIVITALGFYLYPQIPIHAQYWYAVAIGGASVFTQIYLDRK